MWDYDAEYIRIRKLGWPGWGARDAAARRTGWAEKLDRLERNSLIAPAPASLLERGCGNGGASFECARRGYHVAGVDISAAAIDCARDIFASANLAGDFRVGDVAAMPFYDNAIFDVVVDGNCLHCLIGDRRRKCLAEVRRILRDSGRFVVSTMCGEPHTQEMHARFRGDRCVLMDGETEWRCLKPAETIQAEIVAAHFRIIDAQVHESLWSGHLTLVAEAD